MGVAAFPSGGFGGAPTPLLSSPLPLAGEAGWGPFAQDALDPGAPTLALPRMRGREALVRSVPAP
jgi:hypothetical protein